MAENANKNAVETTAGTGATSSLGIFQGMLATGGGGVYVGPNKPAVGLDEWTKRWFQMSEAERQTWVNRFNATGMRVNVITGVAAWEDYGRKSAAYAQQGGNFTPAQLVAMDARQGVSGGQSVAYTAQDARALVEGAYQQLLGRDANPDEYSTALALALKQSQSTGAAGRQQAVIDYIKNSEEYTVRQENRYLDAIYNRLAGEVQEVQV